MRVRCVGPYTGVADASSTIDRGAASTDPLAVGAAAFFFFFAVAAAAGDDMVVTAKKFEPASHCRQKSTKRLHMTINPTAPSKPRRYSNISSGLGVYGAVM